MKTRPSSPGQAQAGRKARGHGKSLAERASGHLHAGQQVGIGMPLQARAELAQGVQLVDREEAGVGQRRIERRRRMPLGQDEPVAAGLVRVGRVVVHDAAKYSAVRISCRRATRPGCPLPLP